MSSEIWVGIRLTKSHCTGIEQLVDIKMQVEDIWKRCLKIVRDGPRESFAQLILSGEVEVADVWPECCLSDFVH